MPLERHSRVTEAETGAELTTRLNNWVNERPVWLIGQRRARRNIANALTTDILHPVGTSEAPPRLVKYRQNIESAMDYVLQKLKNLPINQVGLVSRSSKHKDIVSKEPFHAELVRENNAWVSREIGPEGVISQARLFDDGLTEVTLTYLPKRYFSRHANPNITKSTSYPTGAKVLFLNHAAFLGISGWGRKTKKEIERQSSPN